VSGTLVAGIVLVAVAAATAWFAARALGRVELP
jgi:hypothetical protein